MRHPITLASIRAARPCEHGWIKLLRSLGYADGKHGPNRLVTLGDVAASNGAQDALWCARCLPAEARRDLIRAILPAVKRASTHTKDRRVHECIATIERWLAGEVVDLEAASSAAEAASSAAEAASSSAASSAAWAASSAAWAASSSAAWAAEAASAASSSAEAAEAAAWAASWAAWAASSSAAWAAEAASASAAAREAAEAAAWAAARTHQVADIITVFGRASITAEAAEQSGIA